MAIQIFDNQDAAYRAWRDDHIQDGFIGNIDESTPDGTRVHKASCWTLQSPIDREMDLTGSYAKVCSDDLPELRARLGNPRSCAICIPSR